MSENPKSNPPAASGDPAVLAERKRVTREQAVPMLMEKFGYVVLCFPLPQLWPWNSDAALGCCVDNYMGARVDGKLFELTAKTSWTELNEAARFLGVGNPIPKTQNALYWRAVMIDRRKCEEIEVVRRK